MNKRKLLIGIQTFRTIREENCYYVDKTPCLRRLVDEGTHYFLSRPRRFGKSLLLDTLKELFEGNEPLFHGLNRRVGSATLDGMLGTSELLSAFDVDKMATEALLFQTGYLTIRGVEDTGGSPLYRLGYPNREVRQSLHRSLLRAMTPDDSRQLEGDGRDHHGPGRRQARRRSERGDRNPASFRRPFCAAFESAYSWHDEYRRSFHCTSRYCTTPSFRIRGVGS